MAAALWEFRGPAAIHHLAVAPGGTRVAVCSGGFFGRDLNVLDENGKLLWSRHVRSGLNLVTFSSAGPSLILESNRPDQRVEECDSAGRTVGSYWIEGSFWQGTQIMSACISDDSSKSAVAVQVLGVHRLVWIEGHALVAKVERPLWVLEMALARDGSTLAAVSARISGGKSSMRTDYRLRTFGPRLEERADLELNLSAQGVAVSPDGRLVAAALGSSVGSNRLSVFDSKGEAVWTNPSDVFARPVGFSTDGSLWAARSPKGMGKGVLELVQLGPEGAPLPSISSRDGVLKFAVSRSLDVFAWAYKSGRVTVVGADGNPRGEWDVGAPITQVALSDRGRLVVAGTKDSRVVAFSTEA